MSEPQDTQEEPREGDQRDGQTFTGGRWIEDDQPGDDW